MSLKFSQILLLVSMATDRVIMGKNDVATFHSFFHPILFILAGNDDMHESLEEFKIRPDSTTDGRKNLHRLILGKFGAATFSRLFLIGSFSSVLAGIEDIHESLDELKIQPYSTTELAALQGLRK